MKDLLAEIDVLFPPGKAHLGVVIYGLKRYKDGWAFEVTTSWSKWLARGYEYQFSGSTPESACRAFLDYVRREEIDVAALMKD